MPTKTVKRKPRGKKLAPKPPAKPAETCQCFLVTGKRERDVYTHDAPREASALALLGSALCPWEAPHHILTGTLDQLQHELSALSDADLADVDHNDLKALLHGMSERARVAIEAQRRIERLPVEQQIANARSVQS